MQYDPTDPGPVLDTYDPDWKARFDAAERLRKSVLARRTLRHDHARLAFLGTEMLTALRSRARHAWERDADLRAEYNADVFTDAPGDLRIPSPPHDATCEAMEAHYARWHGIRARSRFIALLPPAVEWETGVFAMILPAGVTREVRQPVVGIPHRAAPVRMTLVVERHPSTTHVCAIQGPGLRGQCHRVSAAGRGLDCRAVPAAPNPGGAARTVRTTFGIPSYLYA